MAYYFYDEAGEPSWLLGSNEGQGEDIRLHAYRGSCPACPHRTSTETPAAIARWSFDSETRMRLSVTPAAAVREEFSFDDQLMTILSTPVSLRPADRQLARYADADTLLADLRDIALGSAPYDYETTGAVLSPPPPTISAVSTTNLVVSGVDEADLVKTDGRFVYTFAADAIGRRLPSLRIAEITGPGPELVLHDDVAIQPLGDDASSAYASHAMYVHEGHLVALIADRPQFGPGLFVTICPVGLWREGHFSVELFDRSEPTRPQARWRAEFDGYLVASRRIDDQLYLIHRDSQAPVRLSAETSDAAIAANRAVLDTLTLDALTPQLRVDGEASQPLLDPTRVFLPPTGPRQMTPEITSITRIDLDDPTRRETLAILGGVEAVHVSTDAVYLATTRSMPGLAESSLRWPGETATDIHRIRLGDDGMAIDGSGSVEGWIGRDPDRAAFLLSEFDGHLRVLTTGDFGRQGQHRLHVLQPSTIAPGVLVVRSQLPTLAAPDPIGKPGEQLYGVRFVGDRLYAVTFRSIDPLYVIDLADPVAPRIAGELELTGVSDYLHPLAGDLLLGIGKDAMPVDTPGDGRFALYQGLQITLFDVTDPATPQIVDQRLLGERGSQSPVLTDHHAFSGLELADGGLRFAFPARIHGLREPAAPGRRDTAAPFRESGLFAYDIVGSGAGARLQALAPLITSQAEDDHHATNDGRSVLTPGGMVYVDDGQFWTAPWSATGRR